MKTLLLATIAATAVASVAPAHAEPIGSFRDGGCSYFAVSDGTDSAQTTWEGEIHVVAIATTAAGRPDPLAPIRVGCELRINGAPGADFYEVSGTGIAIGSALFAFNADPDDIVTMCDNVTTPAHGTDKECGDETTLPIGPGAVAQLINQVGRLIDDVTCDLLAAQSGGPADQPPSFDIRSDGDVYSFGAWIWDCPPYGSSGW